MHKLFPRADQLTKVAIGAAIEVHRELGPGLLESVYERCLTHELMLGGIEVARQAKVPVHYKGLSFEEQLRCDLLVENCLLIELKTVEKVMPVHKAQVLSYLRLLGLPLGLLINFHEYKLIDGVHRLVTSELSLLPSCS